MSLRAISSLSGREWNVKDTSYRYPLLVIQLPLGMIYHLVTTLPEHITDMTHIGISIGWNDQTATSGAVLEYRGGEFNAITCAHLFKGRENDSVGLKVTQPSFEDYKRLYNASVQYRNKCEKGRSRASEGRIRIKQESEFNDADNFVRRLDSVRHDSPEHYQTDSETATVIKSSHEVVDFGGRRCLQDYALLRLHSRLPDSIDEIHDPPPPMGYLAELNWDDEATTVGPLRYDIHVKKEDALLGLLMELLLVYMES